LGKEINKKKLCIGREEKLRLSPPKKTSSPYVRGGEEGRKFMWFPLLAHKEKPLFFKLLYNCKFAHSIAR